MIGLSRKWKMYKIFSKIEYLIILFKETKYFHLEILWTVLDYISMGEKSRNVVSKSLYLQ